MTGNPHLPSQRKQMVWQSAWTLARDGLVIKLLSFECARSSTGRTLKTEWGDDLNASELSSLMVSLVKRWAWRTRKRFTPGYSLNGAFLDCISSKPEIVQWPWAMRTSCVPSAKHPAHCFRTFLRQTVSERQHSNHHWNSAPTFTSYVYIYPFPWYSGYFYLNFL